MTAATITRQQRAAEFIFGADPPGALAARLEETRALSQTKDALAVAAASVRACVTREIATMAADFLDRDLATIAQDGWSKYRELLDAGAATRASGASQIVPLAGHQISLVERPTIDVVLGGISMSVVQFELAVLIDVVGLAAVVRSGWLKAFESGKCKLSATFRAAGILLGEQHAELDPHLALPLGTGIRLGAGD